MVGLEMDAPIMTLATLEQLNLSMPSSLALGVIVGAILGYVHFSSLKWNTAFYLNGGALKAVALHIFRFAILIAVLVILAKIGTWALISAMASLLFVRGIIVRREKEAT